MEDEVIRQLGDVSEDDPAGPSGASPNLCPEALIDLTRGSRKSNTTSGAQNGARKPPLAASTWMSTSSPVSACSLSRAAAIASTGSYEPV